MLSSSQVEPLKTSPVDHYNARQICHHYLPKPSSKRTGEDGHVFLRAVGEVPKEIGPKLVDDCYSNNHGVWHPDSFSPIFGWAGSKVKADEGWGLPPTFNPFATVDTALAAQFFTEKLCSDNEGSLQQFMFCSGPTYKVDPTRGNLAIVNPGMGRGTDMTLLVQLNLW